MRDASAWILGQLADCGLHTDAFALATHYTIPPHPVGDSAQFDDAATDAFEELAALYSDAAMVLDEVAATTANTSPIRCWPHHFDIATLIEVAPARGDAPPRTISLGMEPGDGYYAEPYFYASMYPPPAADAPRPSLAGGGSWHTREWIGAVLPASDLVVDGQREQVEVFLHSAVQACSALVRG